MNGQPLENPIGPALRTSSLVFALILAAVSALFVPPLAVVAALLVAASLWVMFRYPMSVLGSLLAFMPIDYMVIEFGKFLGLPGMTVVSACTKEVPLLLLLFILWRRNGFKAAAPDWFLLALFTMAVVRTLFDGQYSTLALDFDFLIPYAVGRVALLTVKQESLWARRAVWIVAVLSVLGMIEVFILGPGPRTVLYLATDADTAGKSLTASFGATGFGGMREASTMVGPPYFAALCMIALIFWWVYCRNPLPSFMIAAGLLCSVTRSAWLGTALAILVLAVMMEQKKRLALYAALALAMFVAAIPVLGLKDYLLATKTGEDSSVEGHRETLKEGVDYITDNPFGGGNAKVGTAGARTSNNAPLLESSYLMTAGEYGILAMFCFIAFLLSVMHLAWRQQSRLGYAVIGILIGIGVAMTVLKLHNDRRMACWLWFPIGLVVRSSISRNFSHVSTLPQTQREE